MWLMLLPAFAQTEEPGWTNTFRETRGSEGARVAGSGENGFFVIEPLQEKTPSVELSWFDNGVPQEQWKKNIRIEQPANGTQQYDHAYVSGQRLYLFTSGTTNDGDQLQAYVSVFNTSGELLSGPTLIHYFNSDGKEQKAFLITEFSPDGSKILVLFDSPFERKTSETIPVKVYDAELDMLWEKALELPSDKNIIQVHSYRVDNEGGIYMMSGQNPLKNNVPWQKPQGSRYIVLYYNFQLNRLKEYDVSLKDKQVVSAQFAINHFNELVIGGYYSNDFRFSVAGTFLFILNARAEGIKAAAFMAFQNEFLLHFMNQKQADRKGTLSDFYLDHLLIGEDDNYYLVGEQYYVTEEIIMDPTTGRQLLERRYNYDDIIVTRVNSDGRIEWSAKVPKRQYDLSNNPQSSYTCHLVKNALALCFNDHPENTTRLAETPQGDATSWNGSRGGIITRVNVTSDGQVHRSTLVNQKELDLLLIPSVSGKDPYRLPVLGFMGGRDYRFYVLP
jgi:hypothetical protein